jgi:hypothetical protein
MAERLTIVHGPGGSTTVLNAQGSPGRSDGEFQDSLNFPLDGLFGSTSAAAGPRPISGLPSLCDVAPSQFARFPRDEYFTIDSHWLEPSLLGSVAIESPILEPAAGLGHIVVELRRHRFRVTASDLYAHPNPLIDDIATADIFDLDSLAGYRWVVSNLPYQRQNDILRHLLPIAARDDCSVAVLARSEWRSARDRRALIHANRRFAGEIALSRRPVWIRPAIASPRHWFSWFIFSPEPRAPGQDAFLPFAGPDREPRTGRLPGFMRS